MLGLSSKIKPGFESPAMTGSFRYGKTPYLEFDGVDQYLDWGNVANTGEKLGTDSFSIMIVMRSKIPEDAVSEQKFIFQYGMYGAGQGATGAVGPSVALYWDSEESGDKRFVKFLLDDGTGTSFWRSPFKMDTNISPSAPYFLFITVDQDTDESGRPTINWIYCKGNSAGNPVESGSSQIGETGGGYTRGNTLTSANTGLGATGGSWLFGARRKSVTGLEDIRKFAAMEIYEFAIWKDRIINIAEAKLMSQHGNSAENGTWRDVRYTRIGFTGHQFPAWYWRVKPRGYGAPISTGNRINNQWVDFSVPGTNTQGVGTTGIFNNGSNLSGIGYTDFKDTDYNNWIEESE